MVLYGAHFGPAEIATLQLDLTGGKIVTSLASTQLLFDGIAAPVIYALTGQSSSIVPYGVQNKPSTTIQYIYQGAFSNSVQVPVTAVAPALPSADASGQGPGAILDLSYRLNSPSNPAKAGDVVQLYGIGAGALKTPSPDGALVSGTPPVPVADVAVQIGGKDATVLYAGGAPGLTNALLQVNVQIPAGLTPGPQPIVLKVGTVASPATVTVAVQ